MFDQIDYISLVDWTGRIIRDDAQLHCIPVNVGLVNPIRQRGAIAENLPPILKRLNVDIDAWLLQTQHFEKHYQALFSKRRQKPKRAA